MKQIIAIAFAFTLALCVLALRGHAQADANGPHARDVRAEWKRLQITDAIFIHRSKVADGWVVVVIGHGNGFARSATFIPDYKHEWLRPDKND